MTELEILRKQLLEQQKFASLGKLSAGIAHEIQNPLNFVINFSKMSERLLADLKDIVSDLEGKIDEDDAADLEDIADDLSTNMEKIKEHGERAISIIQGILLISRGKTGERLPTDIPHLVHEYVWLAYHSQRANDKSFNVSIKEDYQEGMEKVMVIPQDLSRAILNVVNNAYYAIKQRTVKEQEETNESYVPTLSVAVSTELVKIAEGGEPVELTRHDKPVAVIISYEEFQARKPKESFIDKLEKLKEKYADVLDDKGFLDDMKKEYPDEKYMKKIDSIWSEV